MKRKKDESPNRRLPRKLIKNIKEKDQPKSQQNLLDLWRKQTDRSENILPRTSRGFTSRHDLNFFRPHYRVADSDSSDNDADSGVKQTTEKALSPKSATTGTIQP